MTLTGVLPRDSAGYMFVGPQGWLPAGTRVGSTDYAVTHNYLVGPDGTTPLQNANGVYIQGPSASNTTLLGSPVAIGGRASSASPGDVGADGAAVFGWFDRKGRLVVRLGDGANLTPAGDAQSRALHVIQGNGTQTMPSGDALARPIFTRPGDGTNGTPAGDTQARAIQMRLGDGTNQTPAGDAQARPIFTRLSDGTNALMPASAALSDTTANPTTTQIGAAIQTWNGTTWERAHGNFDTVNLASAARTATTQAPDLINRNARGVLYALVVTANPGGGQTLQLQVQGAVGGVAQFVMNAFATITANGTYLYLIYPGATTVGAITGSLATNAPRTLQTFVIHSAGGSWTYALVSCLLM